MATPTIYRPIDQILENFALLVDQELGLSQMYLFGSYAKGTSSEESDIDIAIVSNFFHGDPIEDTLKLMRIRRKVDYRIEPHAFTAKDFNLSNPFVREIIETGIRVV